MDGTAVTALVLQFLHEAGHEEAREALERSAGVRMAEQEYAGPAQLRRIADEWAELQAALRPLPAGECVVDEELAVQGHGRVARVAVACVAAAHGKGLLAARVAPGRVQGALLAASTAADRSGAVWRLEGRGRCVRAGELPASAAPCISAQFHPSARGLLATGAMDGEVRVLAGLHEAPAAARVLWSARAHEKYVVRLRWTCAGLATASHDRTVALFQPSAPSADGADGADDAQWQGMREARRWSFAGVVEALEATPDLRTLVVAVRGDNYLTYVDLAAADMPLRRVNMNANLDDHVSFTALDLRCSPSGAHLLVQTDKDRVIVMRTGTSLHVRSLYGASNDAFSQPRAVWHPSGKYIFGTSQDRRVYVWDVVSGKVEYTIEGHSQFVRDLCFHPTEDVLLTCSYDRSLRWWGPEEEDEAEQEQQQEEQQQQQQQQEE